MNKAILLLVFTILSLSAISQELGGFSPKLNWQSIDSKTSRIIFNPENQKIAFQVQGIIARLNFKENNIGPKRKKIDLILRNHSSVSNAFVGLAPFKSEFYLNPSSNNFTLGTLNWPYLLAIHEYQHVLQFSNTQYGISKWAYFLGGELTWASVVFLTTPDWFFEGDAVRAETEYSKQGRGRIPSFLNGFRQFAVENTMPSYSTIRNGSINKNLPNHYPLGYLMNKYGRETQGPTFWTQVIKETAQLRGIFYPFSKALKRNSGLNSKQFYNAAMDYYKSELNIEDSSKNETFIGNSKDDVSEIKSYSNLQIDEKTGTKYLISGSFNKPSSIFSIDENNKLNKLHLLGLRQSNYFDVYNNLILYTSSYVHPRWSLNDYSDLSIYNISSKKLKRITKGKRIFSPQFFDDGKKIIAVEMDSTSNAHLKIYSSEGIEIKSFENPNHYYFTYPQYKNEHILVGIRDSLGRSTLALFDVKTETYNFLIPWTYHQFGIPNWQNDLIYFTASFSGIDHIYQLNINDKFLKKISHGQRAHYQPFLDSKYQLLYYQTFSLNGNYISKTKLKPHRSKNFNIKTLEEVIPLKYAENSDSIPVHSSYNEQNISNYHKVKKLINFHSWSILAIDPNYQMALFSNNVLNTLDASAGINYNRNENGFGYFAKFIYAQYFTNFNLQVSNKKRSSLNSLDQRIYWNELELKTGLSIPLDYSFNKFSRKVNLNGGYQISNINYTSNAYQDKKLQSVYAGYTVLMKRIKARKNIFTHLGIYSELEYNTSIDANNVSQISLINSLSLPGVFQNHSFLIESGFQKNENPNQYSYSDNFNYTNGFGSTYNLQIAGVKFNYHLPIAYANKGVLGLAYLYRTRLNLFYNYSEAENTSQSNKYESTGAELIFDLNLMNSFSTSIGFRYSRLLQGQAYSISSKKNIFELFIPINRF